MGVVISGKLLSPAPLPEYRKSKPPEVDGRPTAATATLILRGKLISHRGSPNSSGVWWTSSGDAPDEVLSPESNHTALMTKRAALEALLSQQNQILELQPWDGAAPTKYVARLRELVYPEGIVFNVCDYVATFDVDVQGATNEGVESLSETWSVEYQDENLGTYRVQHSVSVKGRTQRNAAGATTKPAWEHARDYILNTVGLGLDAEKMQASGVLNQFSLAGYNHNRTQTIDEAEGTAQVAETWLAYAGGTSVHDQTTTRRYDANGMQTVSVEGTITGLRTSDNNLTVTQSKQAAMEAGWSSVQSTLYATATGVAGEVLNTAPLSVRVQTNNAQGVLSYGYDYSARATSYPNARSELVSVTDSAAGDGYALIPIPGRAAGPLPQNLSTKNGLRTRTLSIEVEMPAQSIAGAYAAPDTDAYVLSQTPAGTYVFIDQDEESYSPTSGRYSRVTRWSYA
jgi:hypothetical protein